MTIFEKPRALTPATQARIVEALRAGNFLAVACRRAEIDRRTWYYWKALHESGAGRAQAYAEFFAACDRAMALAESDALQVVLSGAPGWRSSAWFLGRRFPGRWARKGRRTLEGVPQDLSQLSDEQLDELEHRVGRRN